MLRTDWCQLPANLRVLVLFDFLPMHDILQYILLLSDARDVPNVLFRQTDRGYINFWFI